MNASTLIHQTVPARRGVPPHPALLLLHGLGDTEAGLLPIASQIDPRVYVISARAPFPHSWGGYAWFDLEHHGPGLGSESIEHSIGLLDRFLGELLATYPIDPDRLFIGGFSMGAMMAGAISLLHPERVRGTIMISGALPPDATGRYRMSDVAGLPIFIGHGTEDPVVPILYARMTRDYLLNTPVQITYREYPTGHGVTLEEITDLAAWFTEVLEGTPREM